MEVQLYVYDLTRGMARAMSRQLLGIHIDAVYHTSLVFNNIEYFFGMGVQTCYPGSTHHGQPMQVVPMGTTHLPLDTILEYLESLKEIYTPESYDLFEHNCNNFTNDFAMFLVGKGIPDHISSLPRRVLETPFGQMLKPQIDASMRSITQAPVPSAQQPAPQARATNGANATSSQSSTAATTKSNGTAAPKAAPYGSVLNITDLPTLDSRLQSAKNTAITLFFTSSTCAPCKLAYPTFDTLAEQNPRALFIKIDISMAQEIAQKYSIRATPTFKTLSRNNTPHETWTGADPTLLRSNVETLLTKTFPPHPHSTLKVPALQFGTLKPVLFPRVPPLEKLSAKLGPAVSREQAIAALCDFLRTREKEDVRNATLPDLRSIGKFFRTKAFSQDFLPVENRFAAVDLLRCAMADARVSGFFAAEQSAKEEAQTVPTILKPVNELDARGECPHNLRLVTLQLACNFFSSSGLVAQQLSASSTASAGESGPPQLAQQLVQLISTSLLLSSSKSETDKATTASPKQQQSSSTTLAAAASLAYNLSAANYRFRREAQQDGKRSEALPESCQVELAASLLETLGEASPDDDDDDDEEKDEGGGAGLSAEVAEKALLALGYLVYFSASADSSDRDAEGEERGGGEGEELRDLCLALEARRRVLGVRVSGAAGGVDGAPGKSKSLEGLKKEVASLLDW